MITSLVILPYIALIESIPNEGMLIICLKAMYSLVLSMILYLVIGGMVVPVITFYSVCRIAL